MHETLDTEVDQIIRSLAVFDEPAMRDAIEAARDPAKAALLVARLREALVRDDSNDRFEPIALCVVFGEARAPEGLPLLLEVATDENRDLLQEAAEYALQRWGAEALRATMHLLESPGLSPGRRVLAYGVLLAAVDADPALRTELADLCLANAPAEFAMPFKEDGWNPSLALMNLMRVLADDRIQPFLEAARDGAPTKDEREVWADTLADVDEKVAEPDEATWRQDWPAFCDDHWLRFDGADETGAEYEDPQWVQENQRLVDEFVQSSHAQGLPGLTPEMAADKVARWLRFGNDYVGLDARKLHLDDVRSVLYKWLPGKMSAGPEFFAPIPIALEAFFHFLHERGLLPRPEPFLALAREARDRLPELAADPANWGMAKTMAMQGIAEGFDLSDPEQMQRWSAIYNDRLVGRQLSQGDESEEPFEPPGYGVPTAPIRRDGPKVGRNDPCPCGSGKKYKKCCGG
jgi:hypothetical protein